MRMISAIIGLLLAVGAAAPAGAEPPSTLGVIGDDDRRAGMVDLDRFERLLITAARERRPVTYGQVLAFFERRVTPITVSALCRDLGHVCRRVEAAGGPDLACLVVRKSDGMPGDGYFASLRQDGEYDGSSEGPRAVRLLRSRQQAAYAWAAATVTDG